MAQFPYVLENEIKILNISYPLLVKSLIKAWAKKISSEYIRDRYVDLKEGSTKQFWKKVRLRSYSGKKFEITLKSKVKSDEFKIRHEENIEMPNLQAAKVLLHMLWFEVVWYKEKLRVSYQIWKTIFDVDFYDDMPPVLEIEGNKEEINYRVRKLRLHKHKQVTRWAKKLLKHYGKEVISLKESVKKISLA